MPVSEQFSGTNLASDLQNYLRPVAERVPLSNNELKSRVALDIRRRFPSGHPLKEKVTCSAIRSIKIPSLSLLCITVVRHELLRVPLR